MKKSTLLLFPFLLLLACTKNKTAGPDLEKNNFKDVILEKPEETIDSKMMTYTDMIYLGYVTDQNGIQNKKFNPLPGAQIINNEFSLKDINDISFAKTAMDASILSTYRTQFFALKKTDITLTPKISYKLYAANNIGQTSTTDLTLVIKAIYFSAELNPVKDENLKSFDGNKIDQLKESGIYLSKIIYGSSLTYKISSKVNPGKFIPNLQAYLDDQLNNKGANAKSLRASLVTEPSKGILLGGKSSNWTKYINFSVADGIESAFKNEFSAQSPESLTELEFKFKSLKDNKLVN